MSEHEQDRTLDDEAGRPDLEEDPDVEAQGLREVMSVGLAAAALAGPGVAKAADTPSGGTGGGDQTVLVEKAGIDLDLDGYLGFEELERAGYKVSVELLRAEGLDVTIDGLEAAGYKASGTIVGKFVEGDTLMLKRGIDQDLDVILEYGVDAWPNKIDEIDGDDDSYLSFSELERAGYKASLELLHADGYDVTLEGLEAAGMEIPARSLNRFLGDAETLMLKRGLDTGLDVLLDYGVDAWPNKLAELDADADGYVGFGELERAGYKVSVAPLNAFGSDATVADLEAAGYKVRTSLLHEFISDLDTVMMKFFVDPELDRLLGR